MKSNYIFLSKKILTLSILFTVLILTTSCGDDDDFGDQCFDNRTDEPIDLFIDGFFERTIDEDDQDCIFLGDGCFDWYVEGVVTGYFSEGTVCLGNGNFGTTIVIDD